MKLKAVCFDIDGTLYDASQLRLNLVRLWIQHSVIFSRYRKMRRAFRLKQVNSVFSSDFSMIEREALVMLGRWDDLGCTGASAHAIKADFFVKKAIHELNTCYDVMSRTMMRIRPKAGVVETFRKLADMGVRIGIFSDFPIDRKLDVLKVAEYVDFKADSLDCGYLKPDKRCFDYLFDCGKMKGVKASEMLYVGDSFSKDVMGSRQCGWNSVLLGKQKRNEKGVNCHVFRQWRDFDRWLFSILEV
ncbi:MAG: HAD family hydrolase [Sphaerochaetaceae bacterium]|jgi:putative hydrolase of the HAD superfamily|nr:HAD family hydrolase [Sphaerochaetaceae bacterium]